MSQRAGHMSWMRDGPSLITTRITARTPATASCWLLLAAAQYTAAAAGVAAAASGPSDDVLMLFTDRSLFAVADPRLELRNHQPTKGPRVIQPTEPWESKSVFAYNHVVHYEAGNEYRMYYDCIEARAAVEVRRICLGEFKHTLPTLPALFAPHSHCLRSVVCSSDCHAARPPAATSPDGLTWTKPKLGLFSRNNDTANNIVLDDSGVSVFLDRNPASPASERWKMTCSSAAYGSPDGLRWSLLGKAVVHGDDTKPTGNWDPILRKYVIYDRTRINVRGDVQRSIGRCETDNFTHWEKETPGGAGPCPTVFSVDLVDPTLLDVYTNAWTPYPSIESPAVHLFFPSMYHHFGADAPWGNGNDGLLDIRLVVSRDGKQLNYTAARNNRVPFVPLGFNMCGATTPSVAGGWCSPFDGIEAATSFDTSAIYMASGFVPNKNWIYFYSSGQPFTHGDREMNQTFKDNTGIRILSLRKDGFVSVDAPYLFDADTGKARVETLPYFVTTAVTVPSGCPPPVKRELPDAPGHRSPQSGCSYEHKSGVCDGGDTNVSCTKTSQCTPPPHKRSTCHGHEITCIQGICQTGLPGGVFCNRTSSGPPPPARVAIAGGVQLLLNVETSVAGSTCLPTALHCSLTAFP